MNRVWPGVGAGLILLVSTGMPRAVADDWPRWRGPNADGISSETGWNPAALSDGADVAWRKKVGLGYSSVTVKDGRLYTMGNTGKRDVIYCLDAATGKELWTHSYACGKGSHPGPRSTPTVDGDRVYTLGRAGHVHCLDAARGKVVWARNISEEEGAPPPKWGFAGSPVVEGKMLLLNACQAGIALDKASGKTLWASEPNRSGYATPVVYDLAGRRYGLFFGARGLHGVDIRDGRTLWSYEWKTSYDVNASDPIVSGDKVLMSSGYGRGSALLDISRGTPECLWTSKTMRNQFSTSVLIDGYLYGIDGNAGRGTLCCMKLETGEEAWRQELGFGALMAADGKLIIMEETGTLVVADVSPTAYREIARASEVGEKKFWTMPVLSGGRIYCRNHQGDLVCVSVQ